MMVILNIIAWSLTARILFTISACLSVIYFILSMGEFLHICYNHFSPSKDWGKEVKTNKQKGSIWQQVRTSSLFKEIIVNFIILILLVLVFPILHI